MGIREKIKNAKKVSEVQSILKESFKLTDVPEKTQRRWRLAADEVMARLDKKSEKTAQEKNKKSKN
tara:strand:+ start:960 stop:1157 length:198 start_codon:yes stop_codon:yes gene_type:complete